MLDEQGISCTVADARFAKPIDTDLVNDLIRNHHTLITVEEGAAGGFGSQVLHYLANAGLLDRGLTVRALTLPDRLQDHDDQPRQYAEAGLDAQGIAKAVMAAVPAKSATRVRHVAAAAGGS